MSEAPPGGAASVDHDRLARCLEELEPAHLALLDLWVRRSVSDKTMLRVLAQPPRDPALERPSVLGRMAEHAGNGQAATLGELRAALEALPDRAWRPGNGAGTNGNGHRAGGPPAGGWARATAVLPEPAPADPTESPAVRAGEPAPTPGLARRLTTKLGRSPGRFVAAAAIAAAVALAIGVPVVKALVPNGADFADPHAESGRADADLSNAGTGPYGGVIALVRTPGKLPTDRASVRKVRRVVKRLRHDRGVAEARSPLAPGGEALIARDRRQAYVVTTLKDGPADKVRDTVRRLHDSVGSMRGVRLGGLAVAYDQVGDQSEKDLVQAELVAFPLLLLAAFLIFRGGVAALLPLAVGAISIGFTLMAVRAVNEVVGISSFALNLVTALSLGLAIDYSLFILSRFREELATGAEKRVALERTLRTAGRTVAISALTVAAALAALLIFPQRFLFSMGICGILVALSALTVSLTVLPAILLWLGPRVEALAPKAWQMRRQEGADERHGFWFRLASFVMRHPGAVAAAAATALLLLAIPAMHVKFVPFGAKMVQPGASARQVDDALRKKFPTSGSPTYVVAKARHRDRERVHRYAAKIAKLRGVKGTDARFLGERTWRIVVFARGGSNSPAARRLVNDVRDVRAPFPANVGGETATSVDKLDSLAGHLPVAIALLSVTTFLLMFVLTGSVVLPIKALLINALTVAATFGALVLVFQEGFLAGPLGFQKQAGLEATQPVLLLTLALALSTDYGVFLLGRITEAHERGQPTRMAAALGLERTGRIVTAAAVLFCIAVGALLLSPLVFIKLLGLGTGLAVVLDATVARALLVPALIALLGNVNWWAPAPMRRLHARLGRFREHDPAEAHA
ncbi:MAG: putative drug exporter of the superfamily [Thermoleophilaceae bacterium]|nr:putative drug exporter of the superfamily [Thermoleophilaceae bacterium]